MQTIDIAIQTIAAVANLVFDADDTSTASRLENLRASCVVALGKPNGLATNRLVRESLVLLGMTVATLVEGDKAQQRSELLVRSGPMCNRWLSDGCHYPPMLFLMLIANAAQPPAPVTAQASASLRVLSPAVGSRQEWERAPLKQRKEIKIIDEGGRQLIVFVVEYE